MRAKSEIRTELESKLNDDIWKKLKTSLLGRELIAFGAEVISENENVKDTMLLQLNPETADKYGLYLLSQMNEIPITNKKPSAVVVEMSDNSKTFAPYELTYSVGNVHFTNIEYTMRGKTVSLLNGNHKCYVKGGMTVTAQTYGEETYFYDGGDSYYGIRIGNAYPDSIIVVDENEIEIPRYTSDIALAETVGVMYKVVTGVDGGIYIRFVCRENYKAPATYRIDWLDHDAMEFDIDDNTTVTVNNTPVAKIKYTSTGTVDDLSFMRLQLKKEMAKYNGFNTPSSVERYVRGLPYILDAKCEKSDNGINIYVKPSSFNPNLKTYLDFSEVAAHISLNSILFPNIKIRTGKRIMFGIEISGVDDAKLQNGIKNLLQKKFSYENMTFNTVINTSNVLAEIYAKYGIVPTVNLTIREDFVQDKPLSFKPIKNTLKLYNNDNAVVAWEDNDLLYGKAASSNKIPFLLFKVVASMGTMFVLMYRGQPDVNDPTKTIFPLSGYNRFYLYDASTNTIKPFDGAMQNLLYTDTNPCLKYNSWNTDEQSFGNLYDLKFLSTNNALVVQMVFKSSGTELNDDDSYKYWSKSNTELYEDYKNGAFDSYNKNPDYRGKYQTFFFVKTPLALKNVNSESWNIFQNASHGDPDDMQGLYSGLQNYTNVGIPLNIKSNWFIHNNKSYYVYEINSDYAYITNGAKNIAISLNGAFLGMFPYENDLYVVNPKYITRIVGFEGLKEKEEIYQIYKDLNTTMTVTQIIREFDNQIVLKTTDGWYTATGFEILAGNKIGFANLKRAFTNKDDEGNDVPVPEIDDDCKIGGCTLEYVTAYREVEQYNDETERMESGIDFYCYDINLRKTYIYKKTTTSVVNSSSSQTTTEYTYEKKNSTTFWENEKKYTNFYIKRRIDRNTTKNLENAGKLQYANTSSTFVDVSTEQFENIFFIKKNTSHWIAFIDNVKLNVNSTETFAVPLYVRYPDKTVHDIASADNSLWKNTGVGSDSYRPDKIQSFFKMCYQNFLILKDDSKFVKGFEITTNDPPIYEDGNTILTKTSKNLDGQHQIQYADRTTQNWFRFPLDYDIMSKPAMGGNDDYMTNCDDNANPAADTVVEPYTPKGTLYIPRGIDDFWEIDGTYLINPSTDYEGIYKLNVVLFYKIIKETVTSGFSVEDSTEEEELTTIGYYDTVKNSCINDRGTEVSYLRYKTQNPNITNDSYLVLDNDEINFV